jgi:hypothetical protein
MALYTQGSGVWCRLWLLLGLLIAGASVSQAAPLPLHEAEVAVADQSSGTRGQALRSALAEVLVRLSGDRAVERRPGVADLLAEPGPYVQQFGYRPAPTSTELPWRLWVRFDAAGLERAMRERGLPYWGRERPETLVWLAVEQGGGRQLLGEPDVSEVKDWLQAAARRRGVPLIFPLMDLEDQTQVGFSDVWGGFLEPVVAASARYRPQALLIGRLHQSGTGAWQASWTLRVQESDQRWSGSDLQLMAVTAEGVDRTADELAARFSILRGDDDGGRLVIRVAGVHGTGDYVRIGRYFATLSAVQSAQLQALAGDRAEYLLQLQGDEADFERALTLGSVLRPDPGAGPRHYRLQP